MELVVELVVELDVLDVVELEVVELDVLDVVELEVVELDVLDVVELDVVELEVVELDVLDVVELDVVELVEVLELVVGEEVVELPGAKVVPTADVEEVVGELSPGVVIVSPTVVVVAGSEPPVSAMDAVLVVAESVHAAAMTPTTSNSNADLRWLSARTPYLPSNISDK